MCAEQRGALTRRAAGRQPHCQDAVHDIQCVCVLTVHNIHGHTQCIDKLHRLHADATLWMHCTYWVHILGVDALDRRDGENRFNEVLILVS